MLQWVQVGTARKSMPTGSTDWLRRVKKEAQLSPAAFG